VLSEVNGRDSASSRVKNLSSLENNLHNTLSQEPLTVNIHPTSLGAKIDRFTYKLVTDLKNNGGQT